MKKEETKKILEIMSTADGGCRFCSKKLFIKFIKCFPKFKVLAMEIFKKKFNEEL